MNECKQRVQRGVNSRKRGKGNNECKGAKGWKRYKGAKTDARDEKGAKSGTKVQIVKMCANHTLVQMDMV